jgi:hypothetical protein
MSEAREFQELPLENFVDGSALLTFDLPVLGCSDVSNADHPGFGGYLPNPMQTLFRLR